jgi:molybdopterin molybdotransferase
VDGFAVKAVDTFGSSPSLPQYLTLVGEIRMGEEARMSLDNGQATTIHTGGMIPEGADAVVMVENTQAAKEGEIEILRPVAVGENVLEAGEDLQAGEVAVPSGRRLRPQELAGLMALGKTEIAVAAKPRVALLSTGDELVDPGEIPGPGQVRDINSVSLQGLVEQAGGIAVPYGIFPDDPERMGQAASQAKETCDVVVISAGSSVSVRDMTANIINQIGEPGVLVHGISFKPGKPTILGVCDRVPVLGLPGNPVSALLVAELFLAPLIRLMSGAVDTAPNGEIAATMSINVASGAGREDHLSVRLEKVEGQWIAHPVYGRSNLIFTLIRADGIVRIPPQATGLAKGQPVSVRLL